MLWALAILLTAIVLPAFYCLGAWITKRHYWDHIGFAGVMLVVVAIVGGIVIGSIYFIHAVLVNLTSEPTQPTSITREIGR